MPYISLKLTPWMYGRCNRMCVTKYSSAARVMRENELQSPMLAYAKLGIKFPAVIDGFDNRVESAYTGWPDRMYLIASDGRVLYKSKPGPFGFHPKDLSVAIQTAVSQR